MTLDSFISELIGLRDKHQAGSLEVFSQDGQGGSYQCGNPRVKQIHDIYAEWGAILDLQESGSLEPIIVIHMDN